jgi:hypothetical protein
MRCQYRTYGIKRSSRVVDGDFSQGVNPDEWMPLDQGIDSLVAKTKKVA